MGAKHATRGVIFIYPILPTVRPHIKWAMSSVLGYDVRFEWTAQSALPSMSRAGASWVGDVRAGAVSVSAPDGWEHLRLEVTEDGIAVSEDERWSAAPGFGVLYAQVGLMGNAAVSENRIRAVIGQAGGDAHEMCRLLDLTLGQARGDELEPFRYAGAGTPIQWFHRVG